MLEERLKKIEIKLLITQVVLVVAIIVNVILSVQFNFNNKQSSPRQPVFSTHTKNVPVKINNKVF